MSRNIAENDGINDPLVDTTDLIVKVVKKLSFFLIVYSVGYFGFSILWACALLGLILLDVKWARAKRIRLKVARAMALGYEREIVSKLLPELPSWIKLSQTDKVEWLNVTLQRLWRLVEEDFHRIAHEIIEPLVQSRIPDFKFQKVNLGHMPLRFDGITVYDQEVPNKVMMDLDVSYQGDSYVTFQTFSFTGGIKDIQVQGRLRVVLTPLISKIPIIGGLQFYFMEAPRINFNLIKATNVLDIPIIRTKIKNAIMTAINSMLLYPNDYSMKLGEKVNSVKLVGSKVEGILRVHVVEGIDLVKKDIFKSDPYVELSIGSSKLQTPVIHSSLNPKWDFWGELETEIHSQLRVHVWDHDQFSKDDSMGFANIDVFQIARDGKADRRIELQGVSKGIIHIQLAWLTLSRSYSDLETTLREVRLLSPKLHSALLVVRVQSASNLGTLSKPPSCYVQIRAGETTKTTEIVRTSCNPIWEQAAMTFRIFDPKTAILNFKILDDSTKHTLGDFSYEVANLQNYPNMEIKQYTFDDPNSQVLLKCFLKLRVFKRKIVENRHVDQQDSNKPQKTLVKQESNVSTTSKTSDAASSNSSHSAANIASGAAGLGKIKLSVSYSAHSHRLVVKVHEAILSSAHAPLDSYSYVKLQLQSDDKRSKSKTKVVKNNSRPIFNDHFEFTVKHGHHTVLTVGVEEDRGILQKKRFIGRVVIVFRQYDTLIEPITEWFDLQTKDTTQVHFLP